MFNSILRKIAVRVRGFYGTDWRESVIPALGETYIGVGVWNCGDGEHVLPTPGCVRQNKVASLYGMNEKRLKVKGRSLISRWQHKWRSQSYNLMQVDND